MNFVTDAIESVMAQDYEQLELIVSDDGSIDGSYEVITELQEKYDFKYFRNNENIGMVANYRKILFDYATGDWYLNLDGDDYFAHNQVISMMIREILKYPEKPIVLFSGRGYVNNLSKTLNSNKITQCVEGINYFQNISIYKDFNHGACLYLTKLARSCDFYNFPSLNTDYHSLIKLCFHGHILDSNESVYIWRQHENNQTFTILKSKNSPEILAYKDVLTYSKQYIKSKAANNWYINQMNRNENLRLSILQKKEGIVSALKSHFDSKQRLSHYINIINVLKTLSRGIKPNVH